MSEMATLVLSARPKRVTKKPLTYWEEYVATDTWYLKEMVSDVPDEEMHAALECEDWASGNFPTEGEGEDGSGEESDESSEGEEEEDVQWASEGESGSESSDGESEGSTVGSTRSDDAE